MKRADIALAASQIGELLLVLERVMQFESWMFKKAIEPAQATELQLRAMRSYGTVLESQRYFFPATQIIWSQLQLEELATFDYWENVVRKFSQSDRSPLQELRSRLTYSSRVISGISTVLEDGESSRWSKIVEGYREYLSNGVNGDSTLLVLRLSNQRNDSISTQRILSAILSVQELYNLVYDLGGEHVGEPRLFLAALDSGSPTTAFFKGLPGKIKETYDNIEAITVAAFNIKGRERSLDIKNVIDSLPAYEKIAELEERGAIDKVTASGLRERLTEAATGIIKSQTVVEPRSQISHRENLDQYDLLEDRPPPQLLLRAPIDSDQDEQEDP